MSLARIGIPDGTGGGKRNTECPGASLVLTREGYRELERAGAQLRGDATDIPAEGKDYVRVFCSRDVETVQRPHGLYFMGLCAQCAELEANQRKDLKARAK